MGKKLNKNHNIDFIYKSMDNLWETIKICDVKVSFILVILSIPIMKITKIIHTSELLIYKNPCILLSYFIVISFFVLWLLSFYISFKTLFATLNPAKCIKGDIPYNVFFPVMNWRFSLKDLLFSPKVVSKNTIAEQYALFPKNNKDFIKQLLFEQQKLAFITSMKAKRANLLYMVSFVWLLLGGVLIIIERYS